MMDRLSKNAKIILKARYLKKDKKNRVVEKAEDLFRRVAKNISYGDCKYKFADKVNELKDRYSGKEFWEIARTTEFLELAEPDKERKITEEKFFELMNNLDFLPNSPTLFNAGRELQQLAACFALPIEDSLDSIFTALHQTAKIHQSGGGTGFNFSSIRPMGSIIRTTQGEASGPVSFMKIFDEATEQIKQGGKRRGANMGILNVEHQDIEEFVLVKKQEAMMRNFNLSVAVDDDFMRKVKRGEKKAKKLFRLICQTSWETGDPGMIFLGTINKYNPTPHLGQIEATNPCSEVPLLPYEACNLGSINLANHVKIKNVKEYKKSKKKNSRKKREKKVGVDWKKLKKTVHAGIHLLENIIDMNHYPLPEIKEMCEANRKIGLGVMGWAEMLFQLEIPYDSEQALELAKKVMGFINSEAKKESQDLARLRGVFPNFSGSAYDNGKEEDRVRNATRTAIAPTGTLSIIAGCSSGIEPVFALAKTRKFLEGKKLFSLNPYFVQAVKKEGVYSKKLIKDIKKKGTWQGAKGKGTRTKEIKVPAKIKKVFVTATEIKPEWHLKMQAAFQKQTDNAVSKTINLPSEAKISEVRKIYLKAYELGCKGITIYRQESKSGQVLSFGETEIRNKEESRKEKKKRRAREKVREKGKEKNLYPECLV